MNHEDMMGYFQKLLPEDFLGYDEISHWKFGPPEREPRPDPRIGVGDLVRLSPFCPFSGFPAHQVDHFQLLYVYSGAITLKFQQEVCVVPRGSAMLLAPGFSRSVAPGSKEDFGVLISMDPQLLKEHMALQDIPSFAGFLNLGSRGAAYCPARPYLLFRTEQWPETQWYIDELCCEHFEPDRRTYLAFPALLRLFLIALDRCTDVTSRNRRTSTPQTVDAVLRYIKTNYATAKLEPTAQRFGFSPNHLSFMLRQHTGMSFQAVKQAECLAQSARLLVETDLTVAQIGTSVGMGNLTRFYKAFLTRYGVTPAEFRRQGKK